MPPTTPEQRGVLGVETTAAKHASVAAVKPCRPPGYRGCRNRRGGLRPHAWLRRARVAPACTPVARTDGPCVSTPWSVHACRACGPNVRRGERGEGGKDCVLPVARSAATSMADRDMLGWATGSAATTTTPEYR